MIRAALAGNGDADTRGRPEPGSPPIIEILPLKPRRTGRTRSCYRARLQVRRPAPSSSRRRIRSSSDLPPLRRPRKAPCLRCIEVVRRLLCSAVKSVRNRPRLSIDPNAASRAPRSETAPSPGLISAELYSLTGSADDVRRPSVVSSSPRQDRRRRWRGFCGRDAPGRALRDPGGLVIARLGAKRTMSSRRSSWDRSMLVIRILHRTGHPSLAALLGITFAIASSTAPYFASSRIRRPGGRGARTNRQSPRSTPFSRVRTNDAHLGSRAAGLLIAATSPSTVLVVDGRRTLSRSSSSLSSSGPDEVWRD